MRTSFARSIRSRARAVSKQCGNESSTTVVPGASRSTSRSTPPPPTAATMRPAPYTASGSPWPSDSTTSTSSTRPRSIRRSASSFRRGPLPGASQSSSRAGGRWARVSSNSREEEPIDPSPTKATVRASSRRPVASSAACTVRTTDTTVAACPVVTAGRPGAAPVAPSSRKTSKP